MGSSGLRYPQTKPSASLLHGTGYFKKQRQNFPEIGGSAASLWQGFAMRKLLIGLIAPALVASSLTGAAHAATKAGASCPKQGAKAVTGNQAFVCLRIGRKLVWSKSGKPSMSADPSASNAVAPTSTPSPTPALYIASDQTNITTIYDTEGCAVGYDANGAEVTKPILQALVNNTWVDVKTIEIGWQKTCVNPDLPDNKYFAYAKVALADKLYVRWKFIGPVKMLFNTYDQNGNGVTGGFQFHQVKRVPLYDPPSMVGTNPITFANITSRINDIGPTVWQNAQDVIARNKDLPGATVPFEIYRSPHLDSSFYKDASTWMTRVNALYANFAKPTKAYLYFTTYDDLVTTSAEIGKTFQPVFAQAVSGLYGSTIYGRSANCVGDSPGGAHTQFPELLAIFTGGSCTNGQSNNEQMVTHEYTHQIQEAQLWNGEYSPRDFLEPCWMTEGQVGVTSASELPSLQDFLATMKRVPHPYLLSVDGLNYDGNPKITWTKEYMLNYFKDANQPRACRKTNQYALSYSAGMLTVEALAAIRGIEAPMSFEQKLGANIPFEKAFLDTFGISWDEAAPILAEVVATQMAQGSN